MKIKCNKKTFRDKQAATKSLHTISNDSNEGKKPIRAYQCNLCKQWHLTSKES